MKRALLLLLLAGLALPPGPAAAAEPDGKVMKTVDLAFEGLPLADLAGKQWQVEDLSGKTWLVNLWATWCGPCMAELPHIQKLHDELKGRSDVGVLTLNFDTQRGRLQPFLDKKGYTFPVLLAAEKMEKQIQEGIPQNWLLDLDGRIRRKATGFDPAHPEIFVGEVKAGLEQLKKK